MISNRLAKMTIQSLRVMAVAAVAVTSTLTASAQESAAEPSSTPVGHVLPRNAMPMKGFAREGTRKLMSEAPLAPNCQLTYHDTGAPVISNVEIVAVWWGPNIDSTITNATTGLPAFYQTITNSAYFDWLTEYNANGQKIGRGTFKGAYAIAPSTTSTNLSETTIGNEIVKQINAGVLPKPTTDAGGHYNTLYMIDFPQGVTITLNGMDQSCVAFCAFHHTVTYNGKPLGFGVHPYMKTGGCAMGCGDNAKYIDNVTSVHAHEMIEAVTDVAVGQNLVAWYADAQGCGEIGDICDTGKSAIDDDTVAGWRVQKEWSNKHGGCIAYAKCTSNADCPSIAATCNTSTGQCVQCKANTDCSGATPICNTSSGTCRACSADSDCSGATPHCDTTSDANKGKCVECTTNAQCPSEKPVCTSNACTGCTSDSDCAGNTAGETCDTSSGACGPAPSSSGPDGGTGGGNQLASTSNTGGCAMSAGGGSAPFALGIGVAFAALAVARGKRRRQ